VQPRNARARSGTNADPGTDAELDNHRAGPSAGDAAANRASLSGAKHATP
jgi:hypothetical protein